LELLAVARRLTEAEGLSAEGCCGLHQQQNRGYHAYQGGLRLWDGVRLEALEQRSPLIQALCASREMAWLIHPGEVSAAVRELRAEWLNPSP
jgi:hypothetical protein